LLGRRSTLDEPIERLARAPARRDNTALLVEHDDDLATLLDEDVAAFGLDAKVRFVVRLGASLAPPEAPLHHVFTSSSP
jgi:hypothetical protein